MGETKTRLAARVKELEAENGRLSKEITRLAEEFGDRPDGDMNVLWEELVVLAGTVGSDKAVRVVFTGTREGP